MRSGPVVGAVLGVVLVVVQGLAQSGVVAAEYNAEGPRDAINYDDDWQGQAIFTSPYSCEGMVLLFPFHPILMTCFPFLSRGVARSNRVGWTVWMGCVMGVPSQVQD